MCGKLITENTGKPSLRNSIHDALTNVFRDFHNEIAKDCDARRYLLERHVHPAVIEHGPIGAVPNYYDCTSTFAHVITDAVKDEGGFVAELKDSRDNLQGMLRGGYLALFYSDAAGRFTGIKFRKPFAKDFTHFKPLSYAGAFGHTMFPNEDSDDREHDLIVVEGEFNQLTLQSTCARHAELAGKDAAQGFVYAVATGSANGADCHSIFKLCPKPTLNPDNDDAGATLLTDLTARGAVWTFKTPAPHKDADEFLNSFPTAQNAHAALRALIKSREHVAFNGPQHRNDPHRLARFYLECNHCDDGRQIHTWAGAIWLWASEGFSAPEQAEIDGVLTCSTKDKFDSDTSEDLKRADDKKRNSEAEKNSSREGDDWIDCKREECVDVNDADSEHN